MAIINDNEQIVVNRDYTDNFSIKKTAMETLGTKYFPDVDMSALNIGELGFVLEQMANIAEDSFNTSSIMVQESFPNKATIPESIYSHAAIFQLDSSFAECGECQFIFLLQENEILQFGTSKNNGSVVEFYLDKNTIINIEDIPFTLDYDIKITGQKVQSLDMTSNEYRYSAQYIIDSPNSISKVNDPYLKIRKIVGGHLLLQLTAHQVQRTELIDTIISNTKINYPLLTFEFENNLAGFDIYYKSPTKTTYEKLETLVKFSLPIKRNFCYYKLKDDQLLEITFCNKDGYFKPEFNSEIKIVLYTTLGSAGNFETYTGNKVDFQFSNDKYEYNQNLTIAGKPVTGCYGGEDKPSLTELQALTVEAYSSATEISTENDIMNYFYNYKNRYGNEIFVVKRRDDITERLFSAFLLLKNGSYIYPTNTLFLEMIETEFDFQPDVTELQSNDRFILNPGHVFIYKDGSKDTMIIAKDENGKPIFSYEKDKVNKLMETELFAYTNPFLISVTKYPNVVGLYKNIVNQTSTLKYISSNPNSAVQFISSKITINRELNDKKEYTLTMAIAPSTADDNSSKNPDRVNSYIKELNKCVGNEARIIAGFIDAKSEESGYVELVPVFTDTADPSLTTFSVTLKTDDVITSTNQIAFINDNVVIKTNEKEDYCYIPISDVIINIYILYRSSETSLYSESTYKNKFSEYFEDIGDYIITNEYNTQDDKMTFIDPMNMIRSTVTYSTIEDGSTKNVGLTLSLIPVIKATMVSDTTTFQSFINKLTQNYLYIEECMPKLRNNTSIDIKFYNTYGKSNNYYIGDNQEQIDRVNLSIKFRIVTVAGADDIELRTELKNFIKSYIEQINSSGNNDLYISNLIKHIENNFSSIHHLKFLGINDYSTDYQTISIKAVDLYTLTKEERRRYVPEILVTDLNDIQLTIESEENA